MSIRVWENCHNIEKGLLCKTYSIMNGNHGGFTPCERVQHDDLRKQGSRAWFMVKFGMKTGVLRNEVVIFNFMEEICRQMTECGLRVSSSPTWENIISNDSDAVMHAVSLRADQVIRENSQERPIMIYIEDTENGVLFYHLQRQFQSYIYMFLFNGHEIENIIRKNDMSGAREWTTQLAEYVLQRERAISQEDKWQVEQRSRVEQEEQRKHYQEQIELQKRFEYEEQLLRITEMRITTTNEDKIREENEKGIHKERLFREWKEAEHARVLYEKETRELEMHRELEKQKNGMSEASNNTSPAQYQSENLSTRYFLPTSNEITVSYSDNEIDEIYSSSENEEEKPKVSYSDMPSVHLQNGKAHEGGILNVFDLEYVEQELARRKIEDNEMALCIYCPSLLIRFEYPFPEFRDNLRLIEVCVLCAMSEVKDEAVQSHLRMILDQMLNRGFVEHIVVKQLHLRIKKFPRIDLDAQSLGKAVHTVLRLFKRFTTLQLFTEQLQILWNTMGIILSEIPPEVYDTMNTAETMRYLHAINSLHFKPGAVVQF